MSYKNYQKEYIEYSNQFRNDNASKESVGKLYDLLFELENLNRNDNQSLILSNLYNILGFHLSAYEIFKDIADCNNRKDNSKLYVMKQKSKSHKDNFVVKDLRKLEKNIEPVRLLVSDFNTSEISTNKVTIIDKEIIVFNKKVKNEKIEIHIYGEHKFEDYVNRIIVHIIWLANCKKELIEFYNKEISQYTEQKANNDWYFTLEIYSIRIIIGEDGNLYSEISGGDEFSKDHILDIEIDNKIITSMNYDG